MLGISVGNRPQGAPEGCDAEQRIPAPVIHQLFSRAPIGHADGGGSKRSRRTWPTLLPSGLMGHFAQIVAHEP